MIKALCYLFLILQVPFQTRAQKLNKADAQKLASDEISKQSDLQKAKAKRNWESKIITYGNYSMKFEYRIIGDAPKDGRSLYISLHGGGNTSQAGNDQQWKNQINLYTPKEGVYLAPRAPTNTWNLWHEDHIDNMFADLIKAAVLNAGVNPSKIYLLGYSAGGDGLFQLAPRMADYWAAAAMMAGHPGDASALSLRNLPFAIYMGGADAAYKRNELAGVWKAKLDSLEKTYPGNYIHDVHIYDGMPHWMGRRDTIAIPWLASFKRNALPKTVAWHQDDRIHEQFYWLGVPKESAIPHAETIATISGNVITIEKNENAVLYIYLNDKMLNLDKKIKIQQDGKVLFNGKISRSAAIIQQTATRLDPELVFSARLKLEKGKIQVN
ncbi:MAG: alpha/beta hydrolase [Bacteroidota bacterium]